MDLCKKTMLVLDAATPLAQAGVWHDGRWLAWRGSRGSAEKALFSAVEQCLKESGARVRDMDGFIFCEGPGSMLGVRITAMAIRGWQSFFPAPRPVFSYYSLEAAARLLRAGGEMRGMSVISDARRGFWNVFQFHREDAAGRLERWPAERLGALAQPVYRLEEPRKTPCPVEAAGAGYDLSPAAGIFCSRDFLRVNDVVEAYAPELADFRKWAPERHR